MYVDTYSMRLHSEYRAEELAKDYQDALYDEAWISSRVGAGLEKVAGWLESVGKGLQREPQTVALQTVRISQTFARR